MWTLTSTENGSTFTAKTLHNDVLDLSPNLSARLDTLGVDLYDSVAVPGMTYQAKSGTDPVAAYLNVLTNMPGEVTVKGEPPAGTPEFKYGDCYGPGAMKMDGAVVNDVVEAKSLIPIAGPPHDGAMVALIPNPESAAKLFVAGGTSLDQLHLTLFYLGDADMYQEADSDIIAAVIRSAIGRTSYVYANVSGVGLLGDNATVYLIGDSTQLEAMKRQAVETVQAVMQFTPIPPVDRTPWIAHVTGGEGMSVDKLTYRGPVTFDRVRVAFGGNYYDFQLRDDSAVMAADSPIETTRADGTKVAVWSFSDDPDAILGTSLALRTKATVVSSAKALFDELESKTFHVGQHVSWHYRSAIGHGKIVGVAKKGKDDASTKYKIEQFDNHVSDTGSREGKYVYHYGSALNASSVTSREVVQGKAISPGGRPIDYSSLDRSPKVNWIEKLGGLPKYIRGVARGIAKNHGGKVTSRDIAIAISRMKVWAAGGQHVRPAVQAAAAAAIAQWESMKAKAGAHKAMEDLLEVSDDYVIDDEGLRIIIDAL